MKEIKCDFYWSTKDPKDVIAVTRYAGKTVKAVAKCNPEDTFDLETGMKIAEQRLKMKIYKKKVEKARAREKEIIAEKAKLTVRQEKAAEAISAAEGAFLYAEDSLKEILDSLDAKE